LDCGNIKWYCLHHFHGLSGENGQAEAQQMKTTELVEFLQHNDVTKDQGYNLVIEDIWDAVTEEQIAEPAAQRLVSFFMYQIQEVLLPVIAGLRAEQKEQKD
jgi:hypothetical protein